MDSTSVRNQSEVMRLFEKMLAPLRRRIGYLVTKGVVTLIDPNALMQMLQVTLTNGEVIDGVEHAEPYGFTSHPIKGGQTLVLFPHGDRNHGVAIMAGGREFRLKGLVEGEVALSTDEGDVLHFKRGNQILINSANQVDIVGASKVNIDSSDQVNITGTNKITLNGEDGDIVTTAHTCAFTGNPHPAGSTTVKAGL